MQKAPSPQPLQWHLKPESPGNILRHKSWFSPWPGNSRQCTGHTAFPRNFLFQDNVSSEYCEEIPAQKQTLFPQPSGSPAEPLTSVSGQIW